MIPYGSPYAAADGREASSTAGNGLTGELGQHEKSDCRQEGVISGGGEQLLETITMCCSPCSSLKSFSEGGVEANFHLVQGEPHRVIDLQKLPTPISPFTLF